MRLALKVLLASGLGAVLSGQATFGPEPAEVYVRSYDGVYVAAAVCKPAGPGPLPAVLFIHGGVGGSGLTAMANFVRGRVPEHFFRLGYVVMSTDYRRYHFGEDEIQDVLAAYQTLARYPFVDKERISVVGGSHGGYLAKMVATRIQPAAVVSFAGLTDIEEMFFDYAQQFRKTLRGYEDWLEKLQARPAEGRRTGPPPPSTEYGRLPPGVTPKLPQPGTAPYEVEMDLAWRAGERRELYRAISPKDNQAKIASPLLYLVGSKDRLRFAGKALVDTLQARDATAEYSEHPDMDHGFYWGQGPEPPPQFFEALKVTASFIERHAKKK